jgi:hypothetical protein
MVRPRLGGLHSLLHSGDNAMTRFGPDRYKNGSLVEHWVGDDPAPPRTPRAAPKTMVWQVATALAGINLMNLSSNDRRNHLISARAAIAAMREPTFNVEAVSYHQGMTRADWWHAMIDQALAEKEG